MKIAGLIPAYNASKTIAGIVERIPFELLDWLIIVNDGSTDSTRHVLSEIKTPIPLILLDHPRNLGYGAAQKTLFSKALSIPECDGAVIFHADGGHYPEELSILLKPLLTGKAELVVGSRTLGILHESKPLMGSKHLGAVFLGPMPGYKFIFNKLLTMVQNLCYGTSFHSFHCGFRAVSTSCLRKIHFEQLGNWYDYDTEFLIAASELGARIVEVPVKAFYDPNAGSSVPGVRYGLRILWNCAAYLFSSARSHAPQNELNSQGDEARSGHTNTEYDR